MEPKDIPQSDEIDILDTSVFGVNAKMFSCVICGQKFTNKVNIIILYCTLRYADF